jgi:hypothetical protein
VEGLLAFVGVMPFVMSSTFLIATRTRVWHYEVMAEVMREIAAGVCGYLDYWRAIAWHAPPAAIEHMMRTDIEDMVRT